MHEKLNITRNDLKSCSGYTVQVVMDSKEELADLNSDNPEKAFLTVAKTGVLPEQVQPYYLSDEDIAGLSPNGPHNFFSRITLTSRIQQAICRHSWLSAFLVAP
jgi:hypothetical protein